MDFIKKHLIAKIQEQVKQKNNILKHDHFLYFEEPVKSRNKLVDRIRISNPYFKDAILPTNWHLLDGSVLREIYIKLKNNNFYIFKILEDGKSYKTRIKKNENKRI